MIKIDVASLENELISLNKYIEEYEQNYLSLFNEINSSSFYWQDGTSIRFYEQMIEEKNKASKALANIKTSEEIYKSIKEEYKKIGNMISYQKENKEYIKNQLIKTVNQFQKTCQSCQSLNLESAYGYERNQIASLRQQIQKNSENFQEIKEKIERKIEQLEEIEEKINHIIATSSVLTIDLFRKEEYL